MRERRWNLKIDLIFYVMLILIMTLSCVEPGNSQVRDLDATQIMIKDVKLLVKDGTEPKWSPDEKHIIYNIINTIKTKTGSRQASKQIWIIDADGKNNSFVTDGWRGSWSPDGKKIVYLKQGSYGFDIAIYDFEKKKEFIIYTGWRGAGISLGPLWSNDGTKIVSLVNSIPKGVSIIDLDNLKKTSSRDLNIIFGCDRNRKHPSFIVTEINSWDVFHVINKTNNTIDNLGEADYRFESMYFSSDYFQGIWVIDKNNLYHLRLIPDPELAQPELSPSFNQITFAHIVPRLGKGRGIYVGNLVKRPSPWNDKYEINIGKVQGVKINGFLTVRSPKKNPLNNKTIGYMDDVKGVLRVLDVYDNKSVVELVNWHGIEIKEGDVVSYRDLNYWGVIVKKIPQHFSSESERSGHTDQKYTEKPSSEFSGSTLNDSKYLIGQWKATIISSNEERHIFMKIDENGRFTKLVSGTRQSCKQEGKITITNNKITYYYEKNGCNKSYEGKTDTRSIISFSKNVFTEQYSSGPVLSWTRSNE